MDRDQPEDTSSRRKFLLSIGASGVAAAAAAVMRGQPPSTEAPESASARGYQLTEHVRNYYRTAQI